MANYSWDAELVGDLNQKQKASSFHETDFMRGYVKTQASHTYLATPRLEDYLSASLREGNNKSMYGSERFKERAETDDLASKLGLYHPTTSFNVNLYSPKRNSYAREDEYKLN